MHRWKRRGGGALIGERTGGSFHHEMMSGQGQPAEAMKQFETIMAGYHDLVVKGRREIYKIEG